MGLADAHGTLADACDARVVPQKSAERLKCRSRHKYVPDVK